MKECSIVAVQGLHIYTLVISEEKKQRFLNSHLAAAAAVICVIVYVKIRLKRKKITVCIQITRITGQKSITAN